MKNKRFTQRYKVVMDGKEVHVNAETEEQAIIKAGVKIFGHSFGAYHRKMFPAVVTIGNHRPSKYFLEQERKDLL